jgi:hypothetical protein
MSQILQSILEPNIRNVLRGFGTDEYTGPTSASGAQDRFVRELSIAIAVSVQQYLSTNVTVAPGQATVGGPTAQVTVTPGILIAP